MSRITDAFRGKKALIPFFTCGDPDLETTKSLVQEAAAAGADLIELGIPFSDPTAEGPVIQAANMRALSGGATTDRIFTLVSELRKTVEIPLLFMTYANVIYSYGNTSKRGVEGGTEHFMKRAAAAGIDGLILPDVPFEEKGDFEPTCKKYGLELISLIAPTSRERVGVIAGEAAGFVYCISSLGVTGMRSEITTDVGRMIEQVRQITKVPAAVGFGISTPEQAREMAEQADGVIVGSAVMKIVGKYGRDCVPYVTEFLGRMKATML